MKYSLLLPVLIATISASALPVRSFVANPLVSPGTVLSSGDYLDCQCESHVLALFPPMTPPAELPPSLICTGYGFVSDQEPSHGQCKNLPDCSADAFGCAFSYSLSITAIVGPGIATPHQGQHRGTSVAMVWSPLPPAGGGDEYYCLVSGPKYFSGDCGDPVETESFEVTNAQDDPFLSGEVSWKCEDCKDKSA